MPQLAKNARAIYDFELLQTFEGGLVLTGAEVKSAKMGHINLKGAFLHISKSGLSIRGMHIGPYAPAGNAATYNPLREKAILVHKKEINIIRGKHEADRLTIVPVSVYTKGDLVKLEFALARSKKQHEKRDVIKQRDIERDLRRNME